MKVIINVKIKIKVNIIKLKIGINIIKLKVRIDIKMKIRLNIIKIEIRINVKIKVKIFKYAKILLKYQNKTLVSMFFFTFLFYKHYSIFFYCKLIKITNNNIYIKYN